MWRARELHNVPESQPADEERQRGSDPAESYGPCEARSLAQHAARSSVGGMPYPASFHRLVMIGDLYADTFNVTLSIVPVGGSSLPAVSGALLADVADTVATWWDNPVASGTGLTINGAARLTSIKLNRINAAGRYQDDPVEHTYPSAIPGGGSVGGIPAQLTIAATLRGPDDRARAGRGRMYFPPSLYCQSGIGADGRLTVSNADQYADGVVFLLAGINDSYLSQGVVAVAGIASKAGAGAFQACSSVTIGRVVDTIRSRRNKQLEDFVTQTM